MGFTKEAKEKLQRHYGSDDIEGPLQNHLLELGSDIGFFSDLARQPRAGRFWRGLGPQAYDRDIGNVEGQVLSPARPWPVTNSPNPLDPRFFADIPARSPGSRAVSASSDRLLAVRAGLDPAGHGSRLMTDFYDRARVRPRIAGPDSPTTISPRSARR